jgi:hypothetical protein
MLSNLLEYGGDVWLLTVTAPGADVLPWQDGRVDEAAAREWNRTAQARWSELHRWARQATARELAPPASLARVWQMQRRGVLHLHLAVGVGSPAERARAKLYVAKLRERAKEFGFGFIDAVDRDGKSGRSRVLEAHRAAGYMSRYLGESSQLAQAVKLKERPRRLVWISPELTRATGCTMRRLRRVRMLWCIRVRGAVSWAGNLPVWFRDPVELGRVHALALFVPAPP